MWGLPLQRVSVPAASDLISQQHLVHLLCFCLFQQAHECAYQLSCWQVWVTCGFLTAPVIHCPGQDNLFLSFAIFGIRLAGLDVTVKDMQ